MLSGAAIYVQRSFSSGQEEPQTENLLGILSCYNFRGMLVCPHWQTKLLVGSVTALAGTLASRSFFGSAVGEIGPLPTKNVWAFLIFNMISLIII